MGPMDKGVNALLSFRDVIPATLHGGGRFVLPRKAFTAAYIRAFEEGLLPRRVEQALEALSFMPRFSSRLSDRYVQRQDRRLQKRAIRAHH